MTIALITLCLGVKMKPPLLCGGLLSLLEISYQTTSSTTTFQALLGSLIPMVLKRLFQTDGNLQTSTSEKVQSTCYPRSTEGKPLSTITNSTTMTNHTNFSNQMIMQLGLTLHCHLQNPIPISLRLSQKIISD
ncbi:hypothetical protein CMV_011714 [Castanea mollissima]|uniref:Uncharacterized protein n=1 Tax=Castanea mollissima TaxID=60419 RepID=A0A8J4R2R0_9ROSI|nr:hypothetical protein CMV_011714 [Castanea mollissima]